MEEKICTGPCGKARTLAEFNFKDRARGIRRARCRDCQQLDNAGSQGRQPAKPPRQVRTRAQRLADDAAQTRARRAADLGAARAAEAAWRDRLRDRVFGHYGRSCACCGSTESLTIDHVNGGGAEHRRDVLGAPSGSGIKFYRWLVREGFPDGFQALSMPCNQSKSRRGACRLAHAA